MLGEAILELAPESAALPTPRTQTRGTREAFDAFRADPAWVSARKASEEKAGGSLTEPKGGVVSEFLKPTDYSPLK